MNLYKISIIIHFLTRKKICSKPKNFTVPNLPDCSTHSGKGFAYSFHSYRSNTPIKIKWSGATYQISYFSFISFYFLIQGLEVSVNQIVITTISIVTWDDFHSNMGCQFHSNMGRVKHIFPQIILQLWNICLYLPKTN